MRLECSIYAWILYVQSNYCAVICTAQVVWFVKSQRVSTNHLVSTGFKIFACSIQLGLMSIQVIWHSY